MTADSFVFILTEAVRTEKRTSLPHRLQKATPCYTGRCSSRFVFSDPFPVVARVLLLVFLYMIVHVSFKILLQMKAKSIQHVSR